MGSGKLAGKKNPRMTSSQRGSVSEGEKLQCVL